MLRRTRSPAKPSTKRALASRRPCSSGIIATLFPPGGLVGFAPADVVRADESGEQQQRGELDDHYIRAVQGHADFVRFDDASPREPGGVAAQQHGHFREENGGEDRRADPRAWGEPEAFGL